MLRHTPHHHHIGQRFAELHLRSGRIISHTLLHTLSLSTLLKRDGWQVGKGSRRAHLASRGAEGSAEAEAAWAAVVQRHDPSHSADADSTVGRNAHTGWRTPRWPG